MSDQIIFKLPERKKIIRWLIVIGVLNVGIWLFGSRIAFFFETYPLPLTSHWYAVYLVNGGIYVGKIGLINDQVIKLDQAYNTVVQEAQPQAGQTLQIKLESGSVKNISLLPWGYGQPFTSHDGIVLNRSMVLFWQKLDTTAVAIQQIRAQRSTK